MKDLHLLATEYVVGEMDVVEAEIALYVADLEDAAESGDEEVSSITEIRLHLAQAERERAVLDYVLQLLDERAKA